MYTSLTQRFSALVGSPGSLRNQLVRGGSGSVVLKVTNLLLTFIVTLVLARTMGPEGFGIYAYALSLIMLLAIPVQAGLPTLAVREVARYDLGANWGLMRGLLIRLNQAIVLFTIVVGAVVAGVVWWFAESFSTAQLTTFLWAFFLLPLIALERLRAAVLRGLRKVIQSQLPDLILRPLLFLGLLLLIVLWPGTDSLSPAYAMGLQVGATAAAFLIGAVLLLRAIPKGVTKTPAEYDSRRWSSSVVPLSFIAGMQIITGQTDIIMLGLMRSNEEVGLYRVALQGAVLVAFSHAALDQVVAPHTARLYQQNKLTQLQRLLTWNARLLVLGALPVAATLVFFGEPVLRLVFGDEYAPAYVALAILCAGKFLTMACGTIDMVLKMTGRERIIVNSIVVAASANMLFNALFIQRYGMQGAAAATVLTMLAWKLYLVWKCFRSLGLVSLAVWPLPPQNKNMQGPATDYRSG